MKTKCDMCGSPIINNLCSCGDWIDPENLKDCPFKAGLEKFHEMKQFTFTGDAAHLGCAVVWFRGDYNDCKKVEKFIYEIKKRPYYGEHE